LRSTFLISSSVGVDVALRASINVSALEMSIGFTIFQNYPKEFE
jgi:hypothetical protein